METQHYVLHLLPCRPDFAFTMTPDEQRIMGQHIAYWTKHMAEGKVIVYGPVFDPKGAYGLGIITASNEDEVKAFIAGDPATTINSYEYFLMKAMTPEG